MRPTKRTTWILLLSFLGLVGVESPGCSHEVDNLERNGQDPDLKGGCTPATDDGDPCTLEGCEGQGNAHVVTPGLACGKNGDLVCNATGACGGCTDASQCGDSTACLPWVCDVEKICRQTPSPNGQAIATQIPKDCKKVVCDGAGGEKTVNDDTDVPFYDCYLTTCSGGSEVKTPAQQGTPCTTGGNSCDNQGNCVECNTDNDCGPAGNYCDPVSNRCHSCTDGSANGDESDIDCGGIKCPKCTQGEGCKIAGDCTTNFCADGICCNTACDQACQACNITGSVGTCDFIARYDEDPSYGMGMMCSGTKVCTGLGGCAGDLGQPCTGPTDCASGKCSTSMPKVCVKTTGDMCTQPSECFNNMCTNGVCG
ncbi:MAG TPA: hypothetical protein PK156_50700 [Polyangium sp.]|nr:hypothetical protein [Polyangium sp.]